MDAWKLAEYSRSGIKIKKNVHFVIQIQILRQRMEPDTYCTPVSFKKAGRVDKLILLKNVWLID